MDGFCTFFPLSFVLFAWSFSFVLVHFKQSYKAVKLRLWLTHNERSSLHKKKSKAKKQTNKQQNKAHFFPFFFSHFFTHSFSHFLHTFLHSTNHRAVLLAATDKVARLDLRERDMLASMPPDAIACCTAST